MTVWARPPFGRGEAFRLLDDPARLELLAPETLGVQAGAAGLAAHRADPSDRARLHLDHARLLREHGARTGAPESLTRAVRAARAAAAFDARGRSTAAAHIEAAAAALVAAELTGEGEHLEIAAAELEAVATPREAADIARLDALRAAAAGRRALGCGSAEAALEAAGLLDAAVQALARALRTAPLLSAELAVARMERAALLTGFAQRLRDAAPAERAAADMADLLATLDADRWPVLRARAARLQGEALTVEGDLTGCPRRLSAASRALADAADDAADARTLDAAAVGAFTAAAAELGTAGAAALRAELAFERALALAGAALRRPYAADARREAERALRGELVARGGREDPSAWAAVQLALARLYADEPKTPRRAEAAMACEAALEVFSEAGCRTLADAASETLRDLARVA